MNPFIITAQVYCWFFQMKVNKYCFSLSTVILKKTELDTDVENKRMDTKGGKWQGWGGVVA